MTRLSKRSYGLHADCDTTKFKQKSWKAAAIWGILVFRQKQTLPIEALSIPLFGPDLLHQLP